MPFRVIAKLVILCGLLVAEATAKEETSDLLKQISRISNDAQGSIAARAAWDKLVLVGPHALIQILEAMETIDTAHANWLRTAYDRIVDEELTKSEPRININKMLAFVQEPKHRGRSRRLALETVEKLRSGARTKLISGWLNDPEFRFEAIVEAMRKAALLAETNKKPEAIKIYSESFAAVRDLEQTKKLAGELKKLGVSLSIATHLGFFTDWYVIGPFDARGMKGFHTIYPPEIKVDLALELTGKGGLMRWKRFCVSESSPSAPGRFALVDLRSADALGDADDAVGYAYTEFTLPRGQEAEFRGAADDNLSVWVNNRKEFGFEEYRNGVRLDRHRFKVVLRAGKNTVLVKICQAPKDANNNEPNWEFLLRAVDSTGNGIDMKSLVPRQKPK